MTDQTQTNIPEPAQILDLEVESRRVQATARLAFARKLHPELGRAAATARLDFVAAILAMDEAADIPHRNTLGEQAVVEEAMMAYGQALASLVRGETSS